MFKKKGLLPGLAGSPCLVLALALYHPHCNGKATPCLAIWSGRGKFGKC